MKKLIANITLLSTTIITLSCLASPIQLKHDELFLNTNYQSLIIPLASNFQADARQQLNNKRVIMLYVSAPYCAYCKKLEKEVIFPLLKRGEYENKIMLRKINWHGDSDVVDFDGHILKPSQLLARYKIKITPTLLFLGENGEQIHEPILGYRGGEFYWYYFDAAIEKSNRWLNTESP